MTNLPAPLVRPARLDDVPQLLALIRELADYERALDEVLATEQHLTAALFPSDPTAARSHAFVVELPAGPERPQPQVVGMAVWYVTFSTWVGQHGVWLEDLFVQPDQRGRGLGAALLSRLAQVCIERGYGRLEWWVLDWNENAQGFYRRLGAQSQDEWTTWRVDGAALNELARGVSGVTN